MHRPLSGRGSRWHRPGAGLSGPLEPTPPSEAQWLLAISPRGPATMEPRSRETSADWLREELRKSERPHTRCEGKPPTPNANRGLSGALGSCVAGFCRRPRSILLSPYEARPACWGDCGAQPSFRVQNRHFRAIACRTCAKLTVLYANRGPRWRTSRLLGRTAFGPRAFPQVKAQCSAQLQEEALVAFIERLETRTKPSISCS